MNFPIPVDHDPRAEHDLIQQRWLYHNHVGYVFPRPDIRWSYSNAAINPGRWADFGTGSDAVVTLPVFNLWID